MKQRKKYSDDVLSIMNTEPKFIIRWGITIIIVIFLLLLTGSYFIQYPDVVSADVLLRRIHCPTEVSDYHSLSIGGDSVATDMYIATCFLPENSIGRVKIGQVVNIKLIAFPYQEYGILKGKVDSVYIDSSNDKYVALAYFSDKMKTSYGETIPNYLVFNGKIEIITHRRRILDIFTNPVKSILKRQWLCS
jgi:hypothetical protein